MISTIHGQSQGNDIHVGEMVEALQQQSNEVQEMNQFLQEQDANQQRGFQSTLIMIQDWFDEQGKKVEELHQTLLAHPLWTGTKSPSSPAAEEVAKSTRDSGLQNIGSKVDDSLLGQGQEARPPKTGPVVEQGSLFKHIQKILLDQSSSQENRIHNLQHMMREHALEQERKIEHVQKTIGEQYWAHMKDIQELRKDLIERSGSMKKDGPEYQKTKNMADCLQSTEILLSRTSSASLSTAGTQSIDSNSEFRIAQDGGQSGSDEAASTDEPGSIYYDPVGAQASAENVESWMDGHEDSSDSGTIRPVHRYSDTENWQRNMPKFNSAEKIEKGRVQAAELYKDGMEGLQQRNFTGTHEYLHEAIAYWKK